ncbi:tRNA 2'-O-methyltransferase Trm13 [Schizosaccharomyces cryophilus OY26]|uniref:tRNA:m(4)X modification enzyme TRM13 n=1 Tax=Schizosaccharomyces cryophilus (strain OY26 / ATCC MYA-4695 / CBS 11777 / NBRC 106824 / NRRL Y48691) TaxID=653667 RepID=S9VZV1_SCHCR|nr:tRNA 2'-O-methyltransferase Trm13 [Schizosaccharomyces cryophilus OY26]EPY53213.1 tRNA 2'-O-methyltransferase Trm13 [Schizosaccharomyces cryophilus OY26]
MGFKTKQKVFTDEDLEQIPCPLDPKHTIARHRLAYHLKRCNARPIERTDPYYHKDLNLDSVDDDSQQYQFELCQLPKEEVHEWINLFMRVGNSLSSPDTEVLFHPMMHARWNECSNKKHATQQASLLGHMEKSSFFESPESVYFEFGAGRAELSHYVHHCRPKHNVYILIDRDSNRLKHDSRIIKDSQLNGWSIPEVIRCKIDIKDFKIQHFMSQHVRNESGPKKPHFAYSKHLCGAATDLTLNCLRHAPPNAILIALCCHHHCRWEALSVRSRSQLEKWGIHGIKAFQVLRQMTGWGTNSLREQMQASGGADTHYSGLTHEERVQIGLKCKHIINTLRKLECERMGYNARLVYYVNTDVTLENVALLATK